jgi:hypothetical protein
MEWLLSMKISGERVFMIRVNIEFNDKYWRTENTMVKRTNNYLQNIAHKTKDRVTWTPLKAECEWSCYTSGDQYGWCTRWYESWLVGVLFDLRLLELFTETLSSSTRVLILMLK